MSRTPRSSTPRSSNPLSRLGLAAPESSLPLSFLPGLQSPPSSGANSAGGSGRSSHTEEVIASAFGLMDVKSLRVSPTESRSKTPPSGRRPRRSKSPSGSRKNSISMDAPPPAPTAEDMLASAFGFADMQAFRPPEPPPSSRAKPPTAPPRPPPPRPEEDEEEELDEDVLAFLLPRMEKAADEWPAESGLTPPLTAEEVLDPDGPWGVAARGVEIRLCADAEKGMGAFATRPIASGELVGVYWGERLTMREHALRHGWRTGKNLFIDKLTKADKRVLAAREERLGALAPGAGGAPIRGARNGGAYCFSLFPDDVSAALGSDMLPRRPAYIDGEDPTLSSWCRYINHTKEGGYGCNLQPKTDCGVVGYVWFVARRRIEVGEELGFDYGSQYTWSYPDDPKKKPTATPRP